jgi:hypothetical protein
MSDITIPLSIEEYTKFAGITPKMSPEKVADLFNRVTVDIELKNIQNSLRMLWLSDVAGWSWEKIALECGKQARNTAELHALKANVIVKQGTLNEDAMRITWKQMEKMVKKEVEELSSSIVAHASESPQEIVRTAMLTKVAKTRLPETATTEEVERVVEKMIEHEISLPTQANREFNAYALAVDLAVKDTKRKGAAVSSGLKKADVPTFDQLLQQAEVLIGKAIAQAMDGTDYEHPLEITPEQAELVDNILTFLMEFTDLAVVKQLAIV